MALLVLPNELILQTASHLSPKPLSYLIQTNRFLSIILTPLLHALAFKPVNNQHPLIWASKYGHVPLVILLLNSHTIQAEANTLSPHLTATALQIAAENGHTPIVSLLLESGVDANVIDGSNFTPLLHAVSNEDEEMVQLLLEYGADIDLNGGIGMTGIRSGSAINFAVDVGAYNILEILLRQLQREGRLASVINSSKAIHEKTALHQAAAKRGHEKIMTLLLASGADVNIGGNQSTRSTPLHLAVHAGNLEGVKVLVEWGADVTKEVDRWRGKPVAPLELARICNQKAVVEFLENRMCTSI